MSNGRTVGVIVASVLAIVALAVVIVSLVGRAPKTFEPGSPEAALQAYLVAWDDGDLETAYSSFSAAAHRDLSFADYQRAARTWRSQQTSDIRRLLLIDRSTGNAERVTVYLILEETYGKNLEASSYRSQREVSLVREEGAWRLADPLVWLDPADNYKVDPAVKSP